MESSCSREAEANGNIVVSAERRTEMEDLVVIAGGEGMLQLHCS